MDINWKRIDEICIGCGKKATYIFNIKFLFGIKQNDFPYCYDCLSERLKQEGVDF